MSLRGLSIFRFCGHFVQPSGTILEYLVEGHPRNISVKLFENWSIGLGVGIKRFFYVYLWQPSFYRSGMILSFFGR